MLASTCLYSLYMPSSVLLSVGVLREELAVVADVCVKVYWLPPDSGDKISLSITVLLSFSVLLFVVSDSIPPSSEHTPVLSKNTIRINAFGSEAWSFGIGVE